MRFSPGSTPRSATSRAGLGEFVFHFNRRRNRHAAFLALFLQALCAKPRPLLHLDQTGTKCISSLAE